MIREITSKDIPVLLVYGKHFWKLTPYVSAGIEYNEDAVRELLQELAEEHYLRVAEEDGKIIGFVGAMIVPMIFNPKVSVATEVFFFVHPDFRGATGSALMDQLEKDLEDQVDLVSFGEMTSSTDMHDYYIDRGYSHTETTYAKAL